jgi:hypothetical protein
MSSATLTIPNLSRAIECRDATSLIDFYADNAVMWIIDQDNPPSRPHELNGREAIAAYFTDVCGRAMTHKIEAGVMDGDRIAFTQRCAYPDGTAVFCATTLELVGGRIARQTTVQAWDS